MYVVYYSTSLSPEITRPQKHSLYHLTYSYWHCFQYSCYAFYVLFNICDYQTTWGKTLMVSKLQSFVSCKYHLHTVLQQVVLVVVYLLRQRCRYLYITSAQTDIYIYIRLVTHVWLWPLVLLCLCNFWSGSIRHETDYDRVFGIVIMAALFSRFSDLVLLFRFFFAMFHRKLFSKLSPLILESVKIGVIVWYTSHLYLD